jgi:hypothetical protein
MTLPTHVARADQEITTVTGRTYTITWNVDVLDLSSGTFPGTANLKMGSTQGGYDLLLEPITSTGSKSAQFVATSTSSWIRFELGFGDQLEMQIDNVSVLDVTIVTITEGGFAQLIAGMADTYQVMRDFLNDLGHIRDPYKTPILSDLEREYGIYPDPNLTETVRRDKLASVKYARAGTGTIDNMQINLDRAFPGLFTVYDNDPPINPSIIHGTNLLVDGSMEDTGVTAWSVGASASITKQTTSPKVGLRNLRVARNGVNSPYAEQDILTVGTEYRVTGWARSDGNAIPRVNFGGDIVWTGTNSTDWQDFEVFASPTLSTFLRLKAVTSTGTEYTEWDQVTVSVEPILIVNGSRYNVWMDWVNGCGEALAQCGEALAQCGENNGTIKERIEYAFPTDSNTWSLIFFVGGEARYYNLLVDGDCEFPTTSAWTAGAATLSKQTTNPYNGLRLLRVTANAAGGLQYPQATQNILTIGNNYRISGKARSDGTQIPIVGAQTAGFIGTTSTSWQSFSFDIVADSVSVFFYFEVTNPAGTEYVEFDELQVTPLDLPIQGIQCGEALAQCGEPDALCGQYNGGIVSVDTVDIPANRQNDLERLILMTKPMHSWCLLFVQYV